uniref:Putative phosphatidylinositol N-acetylglucosaminyltransferase subunit Y n=1 Tax=Helianthus annuus TaxID=4232 RepID=A0A251V1I6_HELAN
MCLGFHFCYSEFQKTKFGFNFKILTRIWDLAGKCHIYKDMPTISQFITANERVYWGGFFIIFGSTFFSAFLYTAVISKLLPPSDNAIIFAIQNDRYECIIASWCL